MRQFKKIFLVLKTLLNRHDDWNCPHLSPVNQRQTRVWNLALRTFCRSELQLATSDERSQAKLDPTRRDNPAISLKLTPMGIRHDSPPRQRDGVGIIVH